VTFDTKEYAIEQITPNPFGGEEDRFSCPAEQFPYYVSRSVWMDGWIESNRDQAVESLTVDWDWDLL